jgi:hypothetical protein
LSREPAPSENRSSPAGIFASMPCMLYSTTFCVIRPVTLPLAVIAFWQSADGMKNSV